MIIFAGTAAINSTRNSCAFRIKTSYFYRLWHKNYPLWL